MIMDCQEAIDIMELAMEGRLQPPLRAGFEDHITECAPCGTYFEHLRLTRQALRFQLRVGGTSSRREDLIEAFREEFERKGD